MNENDEQITNYGDFFQQKSKYERGNLPGHRLDWGNKPKTYKTYKNPLRQISLPQPEFPDDIDFWKVITERKSTRSFNQDPLTIKQLGLLLFGMSGITRKTSRMEFRTTPSAGGLYPIEIYPAINNVEDLEKGLYHYNIKDHELELLKQGDQREKVANACLNQAMAYYSAINFIWTAMIPRSKWKYLQRCYRYIYLDCGHIGQNFYLVAEALGLGACTIGAIYDQELNSVLGINGKEETAIYVGVVGRKTS
ncbi:MAG: SagB/ThcOx family dehydrogenase [Promethearchaeota archaeon]|nr:MAG: SagB/ThcOx family dehydrogenase [Candidatus Lokiarchaeota archaeon]